MGMKFFSPDAPSTETEVDYGDGELVVELVSTLPVVDLANATACAILRLLGLRADPNGGSVRESSLDQLIERATRLLNGLPVTHEVIEPSVSEGIMKAQRNADGITMIGRTATLIDIGVPEDRILRRLSELLHLFTAARQRGYSVAWG